MTRKRSRTRVIKEASYQQAQDHSKRFPLCIDPFCYLPLTRWEKKTSPLYGYSRVNTRLIHKRTSGMEKYLDRCDDWIRSVMTVRSIVQHQHIFIFFLMDTNLPEGSHITPTTWRFIDQKIVEILQRDM
jgi:hypothetical protein